MTAQPGIRVLLTDGQQRKTLAAARALGRAGCFVLVGDETPWSTTHFSRHCHRSLVYPPPRRQPARFVRWLMHTLERERVDCLIPMDDDTVWLASRHAAELQARTALLVPEPDRLGLGMDKWRTASLARERGVPHPRSALPSSTAELETAAAGLGWPVVVKPRRASGGRGIAIARDAHELRAAWEHGGARKGAPGGDGGAAGGGLFLQEHIPPGEKYDVCLLFDRQGRPVASFVQRELRCYPLQHGPSTLQESVLRPDLVELALRLLAGTGWRGAAEVEFMIDPRDGSPVLMEINPRFWASLALAIRCGVDFPSLYCALAMGAPAAAPASYPAGVRCRWLLPGDILHFIFNPRRWEMRPSFFSTYDGRTFDDVLSADDPGAAVGFALAACRYVFARRLRRQIIR